MTKAVIQDAIYWLNESPSDNVVSDILSPAIIVQELTNPNYYKLTTELWQYSQLHTGTDNNTKSITVGAIYLI